MGVRESAAELDALLLTAGIWFVAKFLRYAFPPLFPTFRATYDVSNTLLGFAFTAMMLVYALMQFPSGALADRFGRVPVVTVGAVVAAGGALALSPAVPFALLVAAMVLVGVGTGVHKTVAVGLLSAVYPSRTGRALGVLDTLGAFGGVVAPTAVLLAVGGVGWNAVFLAAGGLGLALAAAFAVRVGDRVDDDPTGGDAGPSLRGYLGLFRRPQFAGFVLVTVGFSFAYNGVVAFLPLYLTDSVGLDATFANVLYGVLFLVSVVQPVTGELSDRLTPLSVAVGTLALATLGLAGVLAGASPFLVAVSVVALGLGSHGFRPVRGAYLLELVPESMAGGGLGVVRTVLMGAGALAPAVVGLVSERASFPVAFGVLLVALAVAAGTAFALSLAE